MRFYCIKLKSFRFILLLCLVLALLTINFNGNNASQVFFGQTTMSRKVPIYYVNTPEKKVAISFDAAWGADKTEKIMEICKDYGVLATFFLVGFWVEDYPQIAKKIADNGFEIGTHSNTHPDMTKLSIGQMKEELNASLNIIKNTTSYEPRLFRAPYGAYNDTLIDVCNSLNLKTIQWDVDTLDWKGLSGGEICKRVLNSVKPGSIILCHNNSDHILEALPLILDRLQKQNYKITCVGDLVYKNGVIDNNGMQSEMIV